MSQPSKKLFDSFLRCSELEFVLRNWSTDDQKAMRDYTLDELIGLARERLKEFSESGHVLHEGRFSDDPDERKYCREEMRKVQVWLKKAQAERDPVFQHKGK